MLKHILLISSFAVAVPAFAQEVPASDASQQSAPQASATPAQASPETQATPQPATPSPAVKAAIEREFPVYDVNKSGVLEQTEFAAWMTALRKASDPTFDPAVEESAKWLTGVFTYADSDKSLSVTKAEMATLLSQAS